MLRQGYWSGRELKAFVGDLAKRDPELFEELSRIKPPENLEGLDPAARALNETVGGPESAAAGGDDLALESIILTRGRPVLAIIQNDVDTVHIEDPAADTIKARLDAAKPKLHPVIPAIGRVEITNNPTYEWVGTAWLIDEGLLVTNRHVAEIFGMAQGMKFVYRPGAEPGRAQSARIDFLEEIGNTAMLEVPIAEIVWISPPNGLDVAFLRLAQGNPAGVRPLQLESGLPDANSQVCVIGYPARDSRVPDSTLMDSIYGEVYNKKRLAPGQIVTTSDATVTHDCTTLGGNSGSCVVSLASGKAVALHYSGIYMRANYSVPAPALRKLLRDRPWLSPSRGIEDATPKVAASKGQDAQADKSSVTIAQRPGGVSITLPLTIDVRLDAGLTVQAGDTAGRGAVQDRDRPMPLEDAVMSLKSQLTDKDVISVRDGFVFKDGWITKQPAIVVRVRPGSALTLDSLGLSEAFAGHPVELRDADPTEIATVEHGMGDTEAPHAYVSKYRRALTGKFKLDAVTQDMSIVCHASPDAGWPVLAEFLDGIDKDFDLAMYDLTAPHIVSKLEAVLKGKPGHRKECKLVLDPGEALDEGAKADDLHEADVIEALSKVRQLTFDSAFAPVKGPQRLFDSAYHIKVGVRDGKDLWLSSGNMQSSNQPDLGILAEEQTDASPLRDFNREWHVIVSNTALAQTFKAHIEQDLEDAKDAPEVPDVAERPDLLVPLEYFEVPADEAPPRAVYFKPLAINGQIRVQPLLTPDNYSQHALDLIKGARDKVLFQNQSFKPGKTDNDPKFAALLDALLDKQRKGLDVRIIFRRIGDVADTLERIQKYGFDMDRVRIQTNCHTKGIIVDSKTVLIGSHNWTTAGTVFNRDASLIIESAAAARYFEQIFEFDWQRIRKARAPTARRTTREVMLAPAGVEAPTPKGYARVSWFDWTGE